MKRAVLVLAVACACLIAAPAAFAQGRLGCDPGGPPPSGGSGHFRFLGTVSAVPVPDGNGGGTLQVSVTHGSPSLDGATSVSVNVADDALLLSVVNCQPSPIDFSAIVQGDQVALCGTIDESTGTPIYTAHVVLDCGADPLPTPTSQPTSQTVGAGAVTGGHSLKLHLRVGDAMPGCSSAQVSVAVLNAKGVKVASQTVSGVALNKAVTVSLKLHKGLVRGTYRIVTKATDAVGNHQTHAGTAVLRVR